MALIGHPIIGDKRYSYAYAKQCAQNHKQPSSNSDDADDPAGRMAVEEAEGNSASVALSRY